MLYSPTFEVIDSWSRKAQFVAPNRAEELKQPEELNDLIMRKVNLIIEQLSGGGTTSEIRGDIDALVELIQKRKSQSAIQRKHAGI